MSRADYPRAPMVAWYRPGELVRTGLSILTSTIFGRHADRRLLEALQSEPSEYFDYTVTAEHEPRDELWLDYVADAGDGFDSTYAVARAVAADQLVLDHPVAGDPRTYATWRGRVMVFGGDLTYPVASRASYEQRLVLPYEEAMSWTDAPHPDVYAIPGNHDWYDSLASFLRRFCSQRWFAGWRTQQRVSYFALHLPHDWWLIGTDVQLGSDLDAAQVAYFKGLVPIMGDQARIILCNAEPHWIYRQKYAEVDQAYSESNLRYLEEHVFERKVSVFVAGDLHHYRRHSDDAGHHKIVAGGGGAFLHPTHDADLRTLAAAPGEQPYTLQCSYPDVATSRRLTWRNLWFPISNWRLGLALGVIYLLICRAMPVELAGRGLGDLREVADALVCAVLSGPTALIWTLGFVALVVLFTDTHSRRYRIFGGIAHALAHLLVILVVGWAAVAIVHPWQLWLAAELLATGALIVIGGGLAGSLVVGGYLLLSLNGFGRHDNEAFSGLAIADWKNFLRLHIDRQGTLRIYPIGIDRVARMRTRGGRLRTAADPRATAPRLIEPPIVITRGGAG